MKRILQATICVILLASCGETRTEEQQATAEAPPVQESRLAKIKWILGSWQMNSEYGTATEDWHEINADEWNGAGFFIDKKGDTLFSEGLRLASQNDTLWYLPTVPGQNDGKEVRFREAKLSDSEVVFENPAHDFPQRIVYHKTSDTSILAYIEGKDKGKDRKEEFHFIRK